MPALGASRPISAASSPICNWTRQRWHCRSHTVIVRQAEAAARLIEQRWAESMPETAQGSMPPRSAEGADGMRAARVTVVGESDDPLVNPIFNALFEGYMRRQFTVLQIGHPS